MLAALPASMMTLEPWKLATDVGATVLAMNNSFSAYPAVASRPDESLSTPVLCSYRLLSMVDLPQAYAFLTLNSRTLDIQFQPADLFSPEPIDDVIENNC